MRTLRRLSLVTALTIGAVCVLLLLNITAPNPTGRRYSSQTPLTTGEGNAGEIGGDGERILAADLRLPNNNLPDQRQCVCGLAGAAPGGCNVCVARSPQIANFRIPDFVGPGYIAEAKNVQQLLVAQDRNYQQISEIAAAAREVGMPFWVYVRVDTFVDPAFFVLFDGMQGGIVYYFAVPGYVDTTDSIAGIGLVLVIMLLIVFVAWAWFAHKTGPTDEPPPPEPPKRKAQPDPMRKATDAEDFAQRMKARARRRIDAPNGGNGNGKHH
jgi:hypothetical protein